MRSSIVQLLILISVLFSGIHAGAQEFAVHDHIDQHAVHAADAAHDNAPPESGAGAEHEGLHHHCPIGVWIDTCRAADVSVPGGELLRPSAAYALTSLDAPPLVDPPLA